MKTKKPISILITLEMVLSLLLTMSLTAFAASDEHVITNPANGFTTDGDTAQGGTGGRCSKRHSDYCTLCRRKVRKAS